MSNVQHDGGLRCSGIETAIGKTAMQSHSNHSPADIQRVAEPYLAPFPPLPWAQEPLPRVSPPADLPPVFFLEKEEAWILTRHADVKSLLADARFTTLGDGRPPRHMPPKLKPLLYPQPGRSQATDTLADDPLFLAKVEAAAKKATLQKLQNIATHKRLGSAFQFAYGVSNRAMAELFDIPERHLSVFIRFARACNDIKTRSLRLSEEEEFHSYENLDIGFELIKSLAGHADYEAPAAFGVTTEDEFSDLLCNTLLGGLDLSMQLIAGAIHLCARHEGEKHRLLQEERWSNLSKEVYRYYSPTGAPVAKVASESCKLNEHPFSKGDRIYPLVAAANRDRSVFSAPNRFDVARNTNDVIFFCEKNRASGHRAAFIIASVAVEQYIKHFKT